ncbi:MAG: hypothetical protein HY903_23250 [Deltaproteobacteria bacterium]|nr:hypothetical protein [Deltaproteobacteria bacterium]
MSTPFDLQAAIARIEARLDGVDRKVDGLSVSWKKAIEWIAKMGEHVESLDAFREEVRASLEPLFAKLDNVDDVMHIMRHATADVARRIEELEVQRRLAG